MRAAHWLLASPSLADAVKVTMGPKGRYVALERTYGAPLVTNDGVTVAREIELPDPVENMGAQAVKEGATKTNDVAGDGTTTATLLTDVIVSEGLRNIAAGANPIAIRRGIDKATKAVVAAMAEDAISVSTKEQIAAVGAISARDDETADGVGEKIAEAMDVVGKEGVISVEESQTFGIDIEIVEGMQYDRGYISPYMSTDMERMEAVLKDPYILITDQKSLLLSRISCPCLSRSASLAARCSSLQKTSKAKPFPPCCSTACAAPLPALLSRLLVSAIAVCASWKTLPLSPRASPL